MNPRPVSEKDTAYVLPTILSRATKITVSPGERLACAVVELRESVWSEILHVARCWRVDPQELLRASRRP
jgi:restriction endonuclease Mrr